METTAIVNNANVTIVNNAETIKGDVFIIPAGLVINEEENYWTRMVQKDFENFGLSPMGVLVQVWALSDQCGNFDSHWWNYEKMIGAEERFPMYLPISLFEGKKEGDTVTLQHHSGRKIELTLNQLKYRYRRFGSFENVLEQLKAARGI